MAENDKVRIRMYRQGLGDCFLLTFFSGNVGDEVHMLIDCGSVGKGANGKSMETVIRDIEATTGAHIHVLVVTHEHEDHVSGFNVNGKKEIEQEGKKVKLRLFEELFAKEDKNDKVGIDQVWMAWTERVKEDVQEIEEEGKDGKKHKKLVTQIDLRTASRSLAPMLTQAKAEMENQALAGNTELPDLQEIANVLDLLVFEGSPLAVDQTYTGQGFANTIDRAMDTAMSLGKADFLTPGQVIENPLIPNWRFYVLGPPQNMTQLRRLEDEAELYHFATSQIGDLRAILDFFRSGKSLRDYRRDVLIDPEERQKFNAGFPFDDRFRKEIRDLEGSKAENSGETYNRYLKGQAWRRIDYDWLLGPAESLALQLDSYTNNTSLVLAMEYKDGRVLLFPGDAQLGNWEMWDGSQEKEPDGSLKERKIEFPEQKTDSVDLLKRTVFYKVGHHSSHNATTIAGLQKLNTRWMEANSDQRGLVAMIPLDSETAANKGRSGWNMPAPGLYYALLGKAKAHVLRSDIGWPSADEDQKQTKWYTRNFVPGDSAKPADPKDTDPLAENAAPHWEDLKKEIVSYTSHICKIASIAPRTVEIYIEENGKRKLKKQCKFCVYEDPSQKFRIEYEVDSGMEVTDSTVNPKPPLKEIPRPIGNYIDYYMYE